MTPTKAERAAHAKRLREDEAFQSFMQEVRDAQTATFLNPASSQEDRETAHQMIRAIHLINQRIGKAEADWKIEQKKDQHRAND